MLINPYVFAGAYDTDAQAYITAVETADGQALETGVKDAINAFVVGCKADGIWAAIKALCILAGARTLAGALVPLVGAAPTNFNFVSTDYNRKTGLLGNGSTKYLNTNRNNNADPQNSKHLAIYASSSLSGGAIGAYSGSTANGATWIARDATSTFLRIHSNSSVVVTQSAPQGFIGISRSSSGSIVYRISSLSQSASQSSNTPETLDTMIFRQGLGTIYSSSQICFYSIGESLDLALHDSRVTTLINALAAAIP